MLAVDNTDIAYRYLVILAGLSVIIILILTIIGYFFDKDRRKMCDEGSKYRMYGYFTVAILVSLNTFTYIIPSSSVTIFWESETFCKILGGIQCCAENIINFYVIGTSIYLLTTIYPKFKSCFFKKDKIISKYVYILWLTGGSICGVFYGFFGVLSGSIALRGNRCWFSNGVGNAQVIVIKALAYMILAIFTTVFSIICAILSHVQVIAFKKNVKNVCMNAYTKDTDTYKQVSEELTSLDKTLIKNFTIFVIATAVQVIMTLSFEFAYREKADDSVQLYSGLGDIICILCMFMIGFSFNKNYMMLLIDKIDKKEEEYDDRLVLN